MKSPWILLAVTACSAPPTVCGPGTIEKDHVCVATAGGSGGNGGGTAGGGSTAGGSTAGGSTAGGSAGGATAGGTAGGATAGGGMISRPDASLPGLIDGGLPMEDLRQIRGPTVVLQRATALDSGFLFGVSASHVVTAEGSSCQPSFINFWTCDFKWTRLDGGSGPVFAAATGVYDDYVTRDSTRMLMLENQTFACNGPLAGTRYVNGTRSLVSLADGQRLWSQPEREVYPGIAGSGFSSFDGWFMDTGSGSGNCDGGIPSGIGGGLRTATSPYGIAAGRISPTTMSANVTEMSNGRFFTLESSSAGTGRVGVTDLHVPDSFVPVSSAMFRGVYTLDVNRELVLFRYTTPAMPTAALWGAMPLDGGWLHLGGDPTHDSMIGLGRWVVGCTWVMGAPTNCKAYDALGQFPETPYPAGSLKELLPAADELVYRTTGGTLAVADLKAGVARDLGLPLRAIHALPNRAAAVIETTSKEAWLVDAQGAVPLASGVVEVFTNPDLFPNERLRRDFAFIVVDNAAGNRSFLVLDAAARKLRVMTDVLRFTPYSTWILTPRCEAPQLSVAMGPDSSTGSQTEDLFSFGEVNAADSTQVDVYVAPLDDRWLPRLVGTVPAASCRLPRVSADQSRVAQQRPGASGVEVWVGRL